MVNLKNLSKCLILVVLIFCISCANATDNKNQNNTMQSNENEVVIEKIDVSDLSITFPLSNTEVNSNSLKVKGTIDFTGDFKSKYAIHLYKYIDGSYYWSKTSVMLSGGNWAGDIWPQDKGFLNSEINQGFKIEEVVAIICQINKLSSLPGYQYPEIPVTANEINSILPKELSVNQSLPASYKNILPSLR